MKKKEKSQVQLELEHLRAQNKAFREMVVWGFFEEEEPIYSQGIAGESEICEPITAEDVTNMSNLIGSLRASMDIQVEAGIAMSVKYAELAEIVRGIYKKGREVAKNLQTDVNDFATADQHTRDQMIRCAQACAAVDLMILPIPSEFKK